MSDRLATSYTFGVRLRRSPAEARALVEPALRAEGFGILTEIDVAATMKSKLGVEMPPYSILGVCNPPLAHRALEADPSTGTLLPCSVVLRADGAETVAEFLDPAAAMAFAGSPSIEALAAEAKDRLLRVATALENA